MIYIILRELKENALVKEILMWIASIGATILLAYILVNVVLEKTTVKDTSMEATLVKNDSIIINKFAYLLSKPERFDVIVYENPSKESSYYSIKRVVGLPNETIVIKDGQVYIDGKVLTEIVNVELMESSGLAEEEIKLGKNEYFVLGDNRNNSEDSRFANIANIKKKDIVGEAAFRINNFAIVKQLNLIEKEEEEDEGEEDSKTNKDSKENKEQETNKDKNKEESNKQEKNKDNE